MTRLLTLALVAALIAPARLGAQTPADVWRTMAEKMDVGVEVNLRLRDGTRFRATLIAARDQGVLVQPRTRVPVEVQEVRYTDIMSLERRTHGGMSGAKAAGIGIAAGVGAFFAIIAIALAAYSD